MLRVHFLNVGHGDCTIIEHPSGRITMIDINNGDTLDNNSQSEILSELQSQGLREAGYTIGLTNPIDYFLSNFPGRPIFRYIQSHPDLDHMRGLAAMRKCGIQIVNFWDTEHSKVPEFKNESDKAEWDAYQQLRSSSSNPKVLRLYRGDMGAFWNRDPNGHDNHDGIEILSPTPEIVRRANQQENSNNLSYVLRITYLGYRIVFGGDAEADVWKELVEHYGANLRCDVLKASHHGRDSGYFADAVAYMAPKYTIVSVGKKPDTDASNKYRRYCSNVWSTRWYGNLIMQISRERGIEWIKEYPK